MPTSALCVAFGMPLDDALAVALMGAKPAREGAAGTLPGRIAMLGAAHFGDAAVAPIVAAARLGDMGCEHCFQRGGRVLRGAADAAPSATVCDASVVSRLHGCLFRDEGVPACTV
jgi:hypothetical protein